MKKIAVITSTRADWSLFYPLVQALEKRGCKPLIIATYAHLLPEMGDTIQEMVEDGYPPIMSVPARRNAEESVADTATGFSKAFRFLKPDVAVVLGDRVELMGVASAALVGHIPLAHIAGGTVSEGAIDDRVRNAISQLAQYHFPETEKGKRRLVLMGARPEYIVTAGALGVYNTIHTPPMEPSELESHLNFELGPQFLLGTFHPATLHPLPAIDQMQVWIGGLKKIMSEIPDLKLLLTFPNTDTDPTPLISLLYTLQTECPERVRVVPSLGRVRYINAARLAAVVAGNSSSGIVEIPSTGTPVVNVGNRQQGRLCSKAVIHCALETDDIAAALSRALTTESKLRAEEMPNPYFKPDTPDIIADALIRI